MQAGMHRLLHAVPVAALMHDEAVADQEEAASAKAVRVGPLQGTPLAVHDQVDRRAGQRSTGERLPVEVGDGGPA
jgi:hypothetical protein